MDEKTKQTPPRKNRQNKTKKETTMISAHLLSTTLSLTYQVFNLLNNVILFVVLRNFVNLL